MRIEEQFDIGRDAAGIYHALNNVGDIGYCVAGVKDVVAINDDESRWKIEQRFGFIARTFDLNARITHRDPARRIDFTGSDREVDMTGHITLDPLQAAVTRCSLVIEVDVSGPLAPLVDTFARGPQQALIRDTISNLRAKLEGEQMATPAPIRVRRRPGFWDRLLRLLRIRR